MLGEVRFIGWRWALACILVMITLFGLLAGLFNYETSRTGTVIYAPLVYNHPAPNQAALISLPLVNNEAATALQEESRHNVPFFWQANGRWGSRIMGGTCTCKRISACGCALTSAAMIFKYFGVDTNPGKMNACMKQKACPFGWPYAPRRCSEGQLYYAGSVRFSWERLSREVNAHRTPVILRMHRGYSTHFVVVLRGQGKLAKNYFIHDPQYASGANRRLSSRTGWSFDYFIIYRPSSKIGR